MTLEDYFGGWLKVIDAKELNRVVSEVNKLPRTTLCPEYNNILGLSMFVLIKTLEL